MNHCLERIHKEVNETMTDGGNPMANPLIMLREEFDDWAVLFDPESGEGYGLNPVSIFIWKHLDGKHTLPDIHTELRAECKNMPDGAMEKIEGFVQYLVENGLAGYELQAR